MKTRPWWQSPVFIGSYLVLLVAVIYSPQLFALIGYAELASDLKIKTSQDRIGSIVATVTKVTGTGTNTGTATATAMASTDTATLGAVPAHDTGTDYYTADLIANCSSLSTGTAVCTGPWTGTLTSNGTVTATESGTATATVAGYHTLTGTVTFTSTNTNSTGTATYTGTTTGSYNWLTGMTVTGTITGTETSATASGTATKSYAIAGTKSYATFATATSTAAPRTSTCTVSRTGTDVVPTHTHTVTDISGTVTHTHTVTDVSGAVGGTGSQNILAKWSTDSALTTSLIRDDGTHVGVNSTDTLATFQVGGTANSKTFETWGGYVNYRGSGWSSPYYTYQQYGDWDAIGADIYATKLVLGGFRASQWDAVKLFAGGAEVLSLTLGSAVVSGTIESTGNSIVCSTGMSCAGVSGTGTGTATATGTGVFRLLSATPPTISATATATGSLYAASPAYLTTGTSTATATSADLFASPKVNVSVGTTSGTVAAGDDSRFGAVAYHAGDNPDYLASRVSAGNGISLSAAGSHPNQTLQIAAVNRMVQIQESVLGTNFTSDAGYTWSTIVSIQVSSTSTKVFATGVASAYSEDSSTGCSLRLTIGGVVFGALSSAVLNASGGFVNLATQGYHTYDVGSTDYVALQIQSGSSGTHCKIMSPGASLIIQEFGS